MKIFLQGYGRRDSRQNGVGLSTRRTYSARNLQNCNFQKIFLKFCGNNVLFKSASKNLSRILRKMHFVKQLPFLRYLLFVSEIHSKTIAN